MTSTHLYRPNSALHVIVRIHGSVNLPLETARHLIGEETKTYILLAALCLPFLDYIVYLLNNQEPRVAVFVK